MQWAKEFYTPNRTQEGFLYQTLIQGFEPYFFMDRDDILLIAISGDRGKSYDFEVMMKEWLDDHRAWDTIFGEESRTMFLEDEPCQAAHKMLCAHGTIGYGEHNVTFGFNSMPTLFRGYHRARLYDHDEEEVRAMRFLKAHFRQRARKSNGSKHGGAVFTSECPLDESEVWIQSHAWSVKGGGQWDKVHAIKVISDKLKASPKFRRFWEYMDQWAPNENTPEYNSHLWLCQDI